MVRTSEEDSEDPDLGQRLVDFQAEHEVPAGDGAQVGPVIRMLPAAEKRKPESNIFQFFITISVTYISVARLNTSFWTLPLNARVVAAQKPVGLIPGGAIKTIIDRVCSFAKFRKQA